MRPWGVYIGALFVLLAAFVTADPEGWSNDTRLTFNGADSYNPVITTDGSNNIHVVWIDARSGGPNLFYTKIRKSGSSLIDNVQITSAGGVHIPSIGTNGVNVDISWYDTRLSRNEVWYKKLNGSNGAILVNDRMITSTHPNDAVDSALAVDDFGNIHVAWEYYVAGGGNEIYYTKLDMNGNVLVNRVQLSTSNGARFPSVTLDSEGNIHVVWQDRRFSDSEVYYSKLNNNGTILITERRLTRNNSDSVYPILTADSDDNLHIFWQDNRDGNNEIYYTKVDGRTGNMLLPETRLTNDSADSIKPSAVADGLGKVHLVWADTRDGNNEIYYLKLLNNGTEITNDTRLTINSGQSIEPRLSIFPPSSPLIVWSDTRDGNSEVYYKHFNSFPPNLMPIGNRLLNENQTLSIQLQAFDPENDTLTFSTNAASILPSAFNFNETTGLFEWTPTFRDAGRYEVIFSVTDGHSTVSETITVTVNNVNLAPEFSPIAVQEITEGYAHEFTVNATDFDGNPLVYSTDAQLILPSQFTFNRTTGEFYWPTTYTDYGHYNVTFRASDGNLSDEMVVTIIVRDAQISNLLMVGVPRIGNTVQLLLADRTAINQPYILLMSTSTEQPLALGDGRHVGLTPNTVLLVSLNLPTLIGLRESVGIFNAAGNAIATWTVPNVPELVNTTLHLAFVSLDTVQPGARAIISISPTINTTVIS